VFHLGAIYNTKDYILHNANVITMDPDLPAASVIKISDGKIIYVGNEIGTVDPLRGADTEMIDLQGKTVLPGFIDTHMHPALYGLFLLEIDCRPAEADTVAGIAAKVHAQAQKTPVGQWLKGWGWDDSKLAERRNPTRWDLDDAAPNHPVLLKRTCGHVAVVNSKALELAGINADTPDPEGGHIARDPQTGEPTGIMEERAIELFDVPIGSVEDLKKGLKVALADFARWGFTTVHDMSCTGLNMIAYQELLAEGELNVKLRPWYWALKQMDWDPSLEHLIALGMHSGFGSEMIRIQGVKLMLDGSVGGRTAAMAEPFEGEENNRGILFMPEDAFCSEAHKALEAGLRIAVHAIGERAIEICLKAIETAPATVDIQEMRNRIEHCAIPTDDQLRRIKEMELVAGSSVGFVYWLGDSYIRNLGRERLKRVYPQKTFQEWGIVAPANSDVPICDGNPMVGLYAAVTRKTMSGDIFDDQQNISVEDALKGYTTAAAFASFEEDTIGTLTVGKDADLIVVSANPLEIEAEELKDIEVELTMMKGSITHQK
jgi:predicted amidohydrolase YtcJ